MFDQLDLVTYEEVIKLPCKFPKLKYNSLNPPVSHCHVQIVLLHLRQGEENDEVSQSLLYLI